MRRFFFVSTWILVGTFQSSFDIEGDTSLGPHANALGITSKPINPYSKEPHVSMPSAYVHIDDAWSENMWTVKCICFHLLSSWSLLSELITNHGPKSWCCSYHVFVLIAAKLQDICSRHAEYQGKQGGRRRGQGQLVRQQGKYTPVEITVCVEEIGTERQKANGTTWGSNTKLLLIFTAIKQKARM